MINAKRLFLIIIYLIIFCFSLFAIIQIRLELLGFTLWDLEGNFRILFYTSPPIKISDFITFKLVMFFITATSSFILLAHTIFIGSGDRFENRVMHQVNREIREMAKERKKE